MSETHPVPIQQTERLDVIDVLRGFALLGILLVNIEFFVNPMQAAVLPAATWEMSLLDRAMTMLLRFFAEIKFYLLFSLLFGMGFALQMEHLDGQPDRWQFRIIYLRRLLVLMVFGLIHATLFWAGDILVLYAFLGLGLLPFRKARPETLLKWAVVLFLLPQVFYALAAGLVEAARLDADRGQQIELVFDEQGHLYQEQLEQAYKVYREGDFNAVTRQRMKDMAFRSQSNLLVAPNMFAMFLIGVWLVRVRWFNDVAGHKHTFHRLFWQGKIWGAAGTLVFTYFTAIAVNRYEPTWQLALAGLGQAVGGPMLCLFYVAGFALLLENPAWVRRLRPLANTGQMTLTIYLLETTICTLIFYSYGLGLFGQVDKTPGLLLAVAIYALLVAFSLFWMKRFRYGPMEWLWRALSYWEWPQIRR